MVKKSLDALGVIAPAVCLVHCLATPILLTTLPLLTGPNGEHNDSDPTFHWVIIAVCAIAILPAFYNHKKTRVLMLFLAGSAFVLLPAYVHLDAVVPHMAVAIAGSACLLSANLLNRKYAGMNPCCEHPPSDSQS